MNTHPPRSRAASAPAAANSWLQGLPEASGDPIFAIARACAIDSRSNKVDLSIGVYEDGTGRIPLLSSVSVARDKVRAQLTQYSYLPIAGLSAYRDAAQKLVFGERITGHTDNRLATIQTIGGTGALRVAADFLKSIPESRDTWISDPYYTNHVAVFQTVGFRLHYYPYYNRKTADVDFNKTLRAIGSAQERSVIILHACCHNPTGADLTYDQWIVLADIAIKRHLILLIDLAYLGFGDGLQADTKPIRMLYERRVPFIVTGSFSKNFALYGERCGYVTVVCESATEVTSAVQCLSAIARRSYSNPPGFGARIIAKILGDAELVGVWSQELEGMRQRIGSMRQLLCKRLSRLASGYDANYLTKQHGMFSYTGLSRSQVLRLRSEHAVYLLDDGRMCVARLNEQNCDHVARALADVVGEG